MDVRQHEYIVWKGISHPKRSWDWASKRYAFSWSGRICTITQGGVFVYI